MLLLLGMIVVGVFFLIWLILLLVERLRKRQRGPITWFLIVFGVVLTVTELWIFVPLIFG